MIIDFEKTEEKVVENFKAATASSSCAQPTTAR